MEGLKKWERKADTPRSKQSADRRGGWALGSDGKRDLYISMRKWQKARTLELIRKERQSQEQPRCRSQGQQTEAMGITPQEAGVS